MTANNIMKHFLMFSFLCASVLGLQAQEDFNIANVLADPQTYVFSDGKTTVNGYIYKMLETQTTCCDNDDIYLEVKIDPSGYVLDAKALTGKTDCYKQSIVDIVRNIKWKTNELKAVRSIYFQVKPGKACSGTEGENQYKPIPVTNNPINNKQQVIASSSSPSNNASSGSGSAGNNEYAQKERERMAQEESQRKAREEAEKKAQEEAEKNAQEMMAQNKTTAENTTPSSNSSSTSSENSTGTGNVPPQTEEEDPAALNKFALESEEERLAREAAEAKALKAEEERLKAEAEAEAGKQAEIKAKRQAELKAKKEAELRNKKSVNESEMRARIEAELREQLKAEMELEAKKKTKTEEVAENSSPKEETNISEKKSTPNENKFANIPGYVSTGDKNPDPSHKQTHLNASVAQISTPQFVEQSGTSLYVKNKLKEGGVCGLAQSVADVTLDKAGNVTGHTIFKANTESVAQLMPSILNGMKFKPETIRFSGQIVYIEFKADIYCPTQPTQAVDLEQVKNYLQVAK